MSAVCRIVAEFFFVHIVDKSIAVHPCRVGVVLFTAGKMLQRLDHSLMTT